MIKSAGEVEGEFGIEGIVTIWKRLSRVIVSGMNDI
jgi:hypothetical protein